MVLLLPTDAPQFQVYRKCKTDNSQSLYGERKISRFYTRLDMPSLSCIHLEHFAATLEWLFWSFSRSSALSQREKSTITKNHSQLSEVSCLWDSKYSCSFSRILTTSVATRACSLALVFLVLYQKKSLSALCL